MVFFISLDRSGVLPKKLDGLHTAVKLLVVPKDTTSEIQKIGLLRISGLGELCASLFNKSLNLQKSSFGTLAPTNPISSHKTDVEQVATFSMNARKT